MQPNTEPVSVNQSNPPFSQLLRQTTLKEEVEKNCNSVWASLRSGPPVKADEVTLGEQSARHCKHPKKYIRKDLKEMLCEQFGNCEFIIILRRAVSLQVIPTMLENTIFYCEIGDALDGCLFKTVDCSDKKNLALKMFLHLSYILHHRNPLASHILRFK